jgi:hypothetical protein
MGNEKFWQQEKKRIDSNKDTINPILQQTYEDTRELVPRKHPKALYADCLQGSLFWNQWAKSDDLSLPEMGMIICRDLGCELTYCQTSMSDPYERPFDNCDQQFKALNSCISNEQRRYLMDPQGRSMGEHVAFMLEKKKKDKYAHFIEAQKVETRTGGEYIIKENNLGIPMDNNTKL